jgi:hypothetical protein
MMKSILLEVAHAFSPPDKFEISAAPTVPRSFERE